MSVAKPPDAFAVAQSLGKRLSDSKEGVLGGMVVVNCVNVPR